MNETSREQELVSVFTLLADTLVADYDVLDLLQQLVDSSVSLFDVDAVGLLLTEPASGELELVASTDEDVRVVELMQLGAEAGPCVHAFRTREPVVVQDIAALETWERFRDSALEQGFSSVSAVPMRLRDEGIGAMGLFRRGAGDLNERDLRAAQALADVATIGIFQARTLEASDLVRAQLEQALNSRVVIEQAKGVLAHTHGIGMDEAFDRLRDHARSNRLRLADVARGLVDRTLIF